jgi:co-chaperonin GroES (HSP10)|tara:strand:- start:11828 stop:12115 length:288 start_codon:yes stop_codon:yes gene_type:complete
MKAIGKNILIEKMNEEREVAGGMVMGMSDKNDIRYKKAKVIKAGDDPINYHEGEKIVREGQEIMYDSMAGHSIMIGSDSYDIIQFRDVSLVVSQD